MINWFNGLGFIWQLYIAGVAIFHISLALTWGFFYGLMMLDAIIF